MARFDSVKALVFDVFGTVVDWREGIARDAAPVLASLGRQDIDPRGFADAWRKRYQPAMEECRSGRRAWTRLDVLHRENLDGVLQDHGIDPAQEVGVELGSLECPPFQRNLRGLRLSDARVLGEEGKVGVDAAIMLDIVVEHVIAPLIVPEEHLRRPIATGELVVHVKSAQLQPDHAGKGLEPIRIG